MAEVTSRKVEAIDSRKPAVMVLDFYTGTFLPWCEANLKPSSVHGYKRLWDGTLKVHFADRSLEGYKTHHVPRMTWAHTYKNVNTLLQDGLRSVPSPSLPWPKPKSHNP